MTHIPRYFLALFHSLHVGDELILHKGREPGVNAWKVEIIQLVPHGEHAPIPITVWQQALLTLPDEWQGKVRFYGDSQQPGAWVACQTIFPSVDMIRLSGMATINGKNDCLTMKR